MEKIRNMLAQMLTKVTSFTHLFRNLLMMTPINMNIEKNEMEITGGRLCLEVLYSVVK